MTRPFPRSFAGPLTTLALALALGNPLSAQAARLPLAKTELAALEAQRPARAIQAQSALLGLRTELGLGEAAGFIPHHAFTNPQGRTVVRFHQTHKGFRVWGGEAIAHVEAEGSVKTETQGLKTGITLEGAGPSLGLDDVKAIALKDLAAKGPLGMEPKVEAIAFPTRFNGGIVTRWDAEKQGFVFDREMSLPPHAPTADYVWAYEVRTLLFNPKDGHKEMCYIIDGTTGRILRKWNDLQAVAALPPPADTPATGTGNSYFRGTVPLGTTLAGDGTYSLRSMTRGTLPQPWLAGQGITQTGLTAYCGTYTVSTQEFGFLPYAGHVGNTWGDGTIIPFPFDMDTAQTLLDFSPDGDTAWLRGAFAPQGETSAVDAHYGLSVSWDFFQNVFNRLGPDGVDSSTFAIVHKMVPNYSVGQFPYADNAFWSNTFFGMTFGEGTRDLFGAGAGMTALTELDITGHELSHGVCFNSANLIYSGFSGGLNEANSDCFGKMIQAYADGGATGSTVPDFNPKSLSNWEIGRNSAPHPLRYMYKPSLDGISADGLYDGLDEIDVHYSSGPLNRMFFFLCEGASANPSDLTHSVFLPGGMAGIGNDKAARIWYKTLTEHLASDADYPAARAGAILSARELYGPGSPEEAAVMSAFSAINVGLAPGQAPRPYVTLPVVNGPGSWLDGNAYPHGVLRKVQPFPTRTNVRIHATVLNAADQSVNFDQTPSWNYRPAGTINADGTWTTPNWPFYGDLLQFQVSAHADANQFARGQVILVELDGDQDTEVDALDLGATAMSYGFNSYSSPLPHAHVFGGGEWDFVMFNQAFTNGYPVK
ncbi:MAG TPA: M4 family metallopeptidase [Holophagaceae bacterium]|nr:M4 family metallopeptidase [Holophagaceae bacterium]